MPLPQTGFVTLTNKEPFMKYPPAVAQMLKAHGGGYVGVKPGVKDDAVGSEDARDVDLAPVLELPSRAAATKWLNSDEYLAVKPFRTDNSSGPIAIFEANLLPLDADTAKFGAYVSTIKKFTDKDMFQDKYPPLMKANNAKFGATMIARVPFRGDGSEAVVYQEQCDAYDFAVLIGFSTYENAVEYINDPEFGAEQTKVRRATTTGPLAAIKATSETMGIPQHTGVPHVR